MQDDHTLPPDPSAPGSAPQLPDDIARPPAQIGPYRILQKISEGGMGIVYLAEQEMPIRRRVALKVIKAGMDTKQVVARFEAERQALALMDHACIAKVLDAGATEQGRPYFVMEYVPGIPITEYCDKHTLPIRERLQLFTRVCEGVQHAHQKAIIHRDLKPSNILVYLQDDRPVPKIIDFGVAKATAQRLTERTMFTELGQMIGTPEYMSPEQTDAGSENVDTRTDIYSLGAILYELLVGVVPFDPKELRRAGIREIQRRIREEEPSRPSTRLSTLKDLSADSAARRSTEPVRLRGIIRGDLDWITMKALEKDRTRRYETANGLAMDVRRYLNNEPVLATPPSAGYRFKKLARRHRGAVLVSTIILGLLIAATVSSTTLYLRAEREAARARMEASRSDQVAAFMKSMLKAVGPSVARGRDTKLLREILDDTAKRLQGHLESEPTVRAELEAVLAETYRDLGEYQAAEPHANAALALQRAAHGERGPKALEAASALGALYYYLGRFDAADSLLQWTAEAQTAVLGAHDPATLTTRSTYLGVLGYEGKLDQAVPLGEAILKPLTQTLGDSSDVTQSAMYTLAQAYTDQQNFARAESLYVQLLSSMGRRMSPDQPQLLSTKVGYGWLLRMEKRLPEAEKVTSEALRDMRRVLGNDHSETMVAVNNLGIILRELGKYKEAEPYYIEGLESGKRVLGEKHPETVVSMVNLGTFYLLAGRYKDGDEILSQAIAIFKETMPPDHIGTGIALSARGECRAKMNRLADAQADYLGAFQILSQHHDMSHPKLQKLVQNIADSYDQAGKPTTAAEWRAKLATAAAQGQ